MIIPGAVMGVEALWFVMSSAQKNQSLEMGGLETTKSWYVPLFMGRLIFIGLFIIGATFVSTEFVLYPLAILIVLYLLLVILLRPYDGVFHNIGVILCETIALFAVILVVVSNAISLD
jgi:TRAP-type C4-dicarboxylate transport system permease large subunit